MREWIQINLSRSEDYRQYKPVFDESIGYLLAQQRGLSDEDKAGYLDELAAFSRHVLEDVQQRARQQSQAMAAKAFGYWEPPKQ
jgi:hypothetical protein